MTCFVFFSAGATLISSRFSRRTGLPMSSSPASFEFSPIGVIHSCFKQKFGIPRQPGLVTGAQATLELLPPYDCAEAIVELEGFSHLWIVFVFHQAMRDDWSPTVRPPRLGGNRRVGVFASRSPFRPNPIGLSAVRLDGIVVQDGKRLLKLSGIDLLDGTPVLDIKPYLPYGDAIVDARAGYAPGAPAAPLQVSFSSEAEAQIGAAEQEYPGLRTLIEQVLAADPRPAYQSGQSRKKQFGMRLWDYDVRWEMMDDGLLVTGLVSLPADESEHPKP